MAPEVLEPLVSGTEVLTDAEQVYWDAGVYAYVGEHEVGLRFLREAIERGFCSYPVMKTDPLFARLRADPEFADGWAKVVEAGKACHERFIAETRG